ncbi:MAG: Lon protease family protein, partial [Enterobacterales bacterium]|nr:Lon protease family protein [Enterobacterales bacterium]
MTTLSNYRLDWQSLLPDTTPYQSVFSAAAQQPALTFSEYQPRLENSLAHFCHPQSPSPFMILKAEETYEYLAILHRATGELLPELTLRGSQYHIDGMHVSIMPADNHQANFAATTTSHFADW